MPSRLLLRHSEVCEVFAVHKNIHAVDYFRKMRGIWNGFAMFKGSIAKSSGKVAKVPDSFSHDTEYYIRRVCGQIHEDPVIHALC